MPLRPSESLSDSVSTLNISSQPSTPPRRPSQKKTAKPKAKVAESWDDESLSSSSAEDEETNNGTEEKDTVQHTSSQVPKAPPPTPIGRVPIASTGGGGMRAFSNDDEEDYLAPATGGRTGQRSSTALGADGKRPEKSTAVASRLIAAGLGVRAPRRTEEQREYDRAIREQERRRKEKEAEEERRRVEERERAKRAVWGD